ncbi:tetratricopeptide repeat protein [Bacteroidota bacterium]
MKTLITTFLFITAITLANVSPAFSQSSEQLFQKGVIKEEGEGSLLEAIDIYNQVVEDKKAKLSLQAKALLRIGLCYEKLGKDEATEAYQKLVKDYPGQKGEVKIAKERLEQLILIAEEFKGIRIKQIRKKPYGEYLGTVSADGRFLSYVDWEKSAGDIAIHNFLTGENQILSNDASYDNPQHFAEENSISKNGKHVAYKWFGANNTDELRVVDVGNPSPRTLYNTKDEKLSLITWLSDNKFIILKYGDPNNQICSINILDGTIKVLKTMDKGGGNILFSNDEKFITYDFANETDDGNFDINILQIDGSSENSLIKHPANDRGFGWVPGRKEFLFISDRSGTWDLWAIPMENGKPSGPVKKVYTGIGSVKPMGITENGECYFGFGESAFNSYIVPFNEETGKLNEKSGASFLGSNVWVKWSPDEQYLTYININATANPWQLAVKNLKTGEERKLANNLFLAMSPCWSTDGNSILVIGFEKDKFGKKGYQGAIFMVDVISGETTEILLLSNYKYNNPTDDALPLSNIQWSSDGNSIFMLFFQDRIVKHDLETGKEETLYMQSHFDRGVLNLSPDGKRLLFAAKSPEQKKSHLYTIPVGGGKEKELCSPQEADNFHMAAWSPDGLFIYFIERIEGTNLWRIPAEGGIPQLVWQSDDGIEGFNIQPDGKQIIYAIHELTTEIRVIEGLIQELEKIYSKNK